MDVFTKNVTTEEIVPATTPACDSLPMTDHGEYTGSRGWFLKKYLKSEHSLHRNTKFCHCDE